MDKKLNRQIGYKPGTSVPKKEEVSDFKKPVPKLPAAPEVDNRPERSSESINFADTKRIVSWLKSHPMFAWGRMCGVIGLNKGNFSSMLKSSKPYINPNTIPKIEGVLKEYGYKK